MRGSELFLSSLPAADRRIVLQMLVGIAAAAAAPVAAFADTGPGAWPKTAFDAKTQADVLKSLYGKTAAMSDKITLDVPEIAENGAVVPVTIGTDLPNVTSISILVPENPNTLIAVYPLANGVKPNVASRIKMAKTSPVLAVVESDGKIMMASKTVKVTLGGCGG